MDEPNELSEAARMMGAKGGINRARNLTKQRLSEIGSQGGVASAKSKKKRKARAEKKKTKKVANNGSYDAT